MDFTALWNEFKKKTVDIRPFLRTKIGSRLTILCVLDFLALFFAPLLRGFVGTAIVACVASVYLILIWRKHDREHVIVPAVFLCVPMLLNMPLYHNLSVIVGMVTAIAAILFIAYSPLFGFFDRISDGYYTYISAGAVCVGVVAVACLLLFIVQFSWWIFCIIAFLIVAGVFAGVVFSTAAYTASDGKRQARKNRIRQEQEARYRDYRPRERDTKIYNLDEDDYRDVDE